MEYLVFGRTEYAQPLGLLTTVRSDAVPALDDLDVGTDWLELAVVPADELIWIVRDGETLSVGSGRHTSGASSSGSGRHTSGASSSGSGRHTSGASGSGSGRHTS